MCLCSLLAKPLLLQRPDVGAEGLLIGVASVVTVSYTKSDVTTTYS